MNENLRALYDDFGAEAVKKQMSMQVGKPLQSNAEFLRDMFRMRRQQHQAYIMRRVDHTGSFMVLANATDRNGKYRPELGTISIRQSVKFPLTSSSNFRLTFNSLMSNGTGNGNLKFSYEKTFIAAAAAGYASLRFGWHNWSARIGASKQIFEKLRADMSLGMDDGSARLRLKLLQTLGERYDGFLEAMWGNGPSVRLSLATRPDVHTWSGSLSVLFKQAEISSSVRATYQLSTRSTIGVEAGIENNVAIISHPQGRALALINSWHLAGHMERTISQLTKAHMSFTIAPHGVFATAGFTRHGQTFSVPLMLTHIPTLSASLVAITAPMAIGFILEAILLEPRRRRKRAEQEAKRKKEQEALIAANKARAAADCRLMADEVNRKREAEETKGGLVILQAFYGRHPDEAGEDLDENEELNCRVDVTLPLQYMVQNSQLQVPSGTTKSALIGFYDPVPDEEKWIEVIYLYRHNTQRVLVSDHEALRMPVKSHQMAE
jgi:DnaJ family protein C protein 11